MSAAGRAVAAELAGTAALLAVVVGSGIMGERLSPANAGVALLANSLATGFGLYVLIVVLGPVSGAHLNPAVTLVAWLRGRLGGKIAFAYAAAQLAGALAGVALAHAMFDLPLLQAGTKARSGFGQFLSEIVATSGLVLVILGCLRHAPSHVAAAVGAYIAAAYWFTASTSFANPAVTLARAFTDTFAGIAMADVPAFLAGQVIGLVVALVLERLLFGPDP